MTPGREVYKTDQSNKIFTDNNSKKFIRKQVLKSHVTHCVRNWVTCNVGLDKMGNTANGYSLSLAIKYPKMDCGDDCAVQ